ncbi:MAG TPA: regulatory iron-sulfur-containing complex subunit RicT [Candidatus Bathyarchaeia archaeon]|nr:regulatory iron-sulfur-containing complex subunit RicT [Candidatus Bathyarchaeia archaeon]
MNGEQELPSEDDPRRHVARRTVDVRFRAAGRLRAFDAGSMPLAAHDLVVVESERGLELGEVVAAPRARTPREEGSNLPRVIRRADRRDLARADHNHALERQARRLCLDRLRQLDLPMKLVRVDYRFDGGKALFYFTAESRVDFRELVRDLAQSLHTRIEMRQIGARDETRMIGGVGPCGRELCCSSWLNEFAAISVKMAKEQDLSLNPSKLAGMCGRLKCCLRYEYDTYLSLRRGLPRIGTRVQSVKGDGQIVKHIVLKQSVVLRREEDGLEVEASLEDLVEKRPEA